MNKIYASLLTLSLSFSLNCLAQTAVFPPAPLTPEEGLHLLAPLSGDAGTYQVILSEDLLTDLIGRELTGISFRLSPHETVSWPASGTAFSQYNIYLGAGVSPELTTASLEQNVIGSLTQVRSGNLAIPVNSYPAAADPANPATNAFGPAILFAAPYLYEGGNLLLQIQHSGSGSHSMNMETTLSATAQPIRYVAWSDMSTGINLPGFATFQFSYKNHPLSIDITYFNVMPGSESINLQWATAVSKAGESFSVERSTDGTAYETLDIQYAEIDVDTPGHYSYSDYTAYALLANMVYYRIKMTDLNQNTFYSQVRSVSMQPRDTPFVATIFPVPVRNQTTIAITTSHPDDISGILVDNRGNVIYTAVWHVEPGENKISLNLSSLTPGHYILILQGESHKEELKFVR